MSNRNLIFGYPLSLLIESPRFASFFIVFLSYNYIINKNKYANKIMRKSEIYYSINLNLWKLI